MLLVLDTPADLWTASWELLRIGFGPPVGWLAGGMRAWRTAAREVARLPQITVHELRERLAGGHLRVLDVRQPAEWAEGRAPGATFVTGAELPTHMDEVPEGPLAVVCGSGYRSSAVASLLARAGRVDLVNVTGGMTAWTQAGHPLER